MGKKQNEKFHNALIEAAILANKPLAKKILDSATEMSPPMTLEQFKE